MIKKRGEVILSVNGENYRLRLTLGALAEIEENLGIEDITKLEERFQSPKISDLITIILALLHGGGHGEVTRETFMYWDVNITDLSSKITEVFEVNRLMSDNDEKESKESSTGVPK